MISNQILRVAVLAVFLFYVFVIFRFLLSSALARKDEHKLHVYMFELLQVSEKLFWFLRK